MSKNLKSLLPLILKGVSLLFALLALIFMFALPGLTTSVEGATGTVSMLGLVFGNGTIHTEVDTGIMGSISMDVSYKGGMSYFGLIAFILLVVALVLVVLSFVLKDKAKVLLLTAGALLVVSGVCAFMLGVAGTDVTQEIAQVQATSSFKDAFQDCNLGVGPILFGIFNLLAGAVLVVDELVLDK